MRSVSPTMVAIGLGRLLVKPNFDVSDPLVGSSDLVGSFVSFLALLVPAFLSYVLA